MVYDIERQKRTDFKPHNKQKKLKSPFCYYFRCRMKCLTVWKAYTNMYKQLILRKQVNKKCAKAKVDI